MVLIRSIPDTAEKLSILSQDSRYDLACSCATRDDEHRRRSSDNKWIYPVVLPAGGTTYLLKTLLSNQCVNDCAYCPLRSGAAARRCSLQPEELARVFFFYYRARRVSGLFLSSGVTGNPDRTMERINHSALLLRRSGFRGYIHLKVIPGASEGAIRQSLSLASAVSLNIETPTVENFRHLSVTKQYQRDIVEPLQLISRLRAGGGPYSRIKQTTQFVVGASRETDREIVNSSWTLYKQLGLNRIYFSAYQRGAGSPGLPGESSPATNRDLLIREHRLYQVDWLMRKYGFAAEDIPFGQDGNLSLESDPKEMWARLHPEFFPVNINRDGQSRLLRVPGLGQVIVERILAARKAGVRIRSFETLGRRSRILDKALPYVIF